MVGTSDIVGKEAIRYCAQFGAQARAHLSCDLSRAIGRHDWDHAHLLHRTDLRLLRMQRVGYLDYGPKGAMA